MMKTLTALFATAALAHKVIPADVGYADIRSAHTLELYLAH